QLRGHADGQGDEGRQAPWRLAALSGPDGQRHQPFQLFVQVLPQPGMSGELPGVRELVEYQPSAQVVAREVLLRLPAGDVRLDQVERVLDRLAPQQLGVELAEN